MRVLVASGILALTLGACSGAERPLHETRGTDGGPDDFSVLPVAPLALPASLSILPTPTPGGANLVDPDPKGDAIAVLGGNPRAVNAGGIPTADTALVAAASRNGIEAGVRAALAAEDLALRDSSRLGGIFNILGTDRYFSTYANQSLDAYAERDRFRALGVPTPTAPPLN